ncbi:MAG: beta-N-acetylhexosaminidase [Bacteroidales bacterium]|nr:beta-N-acetylhexosaminidase [Bacteroidales bacterium]
MKLRTLLLALACVCVALVQAASPLSLIPLPASVQQGSGQFTFPAKVQLCVPSYTGDSVKAVAKRWAGNFTKSTGIKVSVGKKANAAIQLRLNSGLAPEAYDLQVTRERIVIEAARPAGFFYALQTLNQLLPSRAVMAGVKATDVQSWTLPVVTIKDHPRFEWRGFMLDEGRHFYGKEEIKKLLDVMAAYKLNRFHWHLTEDQGWRIEIKKYPRLTEVGAWRNSKVLGWGEVKPDGQRYGGFYTQKDAREIVRYAQERFIEIVPEVDIPGHSQAAVAAYPEFLSCDPQNQHEVWLWQGVSPDVINVSHPQAVQFAKDVIDELTAIFPFRYIHLGGDECPTNKWEANEACRQQLASIGSKNFRDLQINFYRQLQDHIAQKPASEQRQLIFWNEVLHGNTRPLGTDITIMAWVGADGAAKDAAQRGMKTILSPQIPYYINRRQSNLPTEPRSQGHGTETVEAVYNYVPMSGIPADLQQQYMGVQANFWTEWVEEASVVQYLMFPRLAAVAEAGWTPQQLRKYPDFLERLQAEAKYYDLRGVDYGKHVFR